MRRILGTDTKRIDSDPARPAGACSRAGASAGAYSAAEHRHLAYRSQSCRSSSRISTTPWLRAGFTDAIRASISFHVCRGLPTSAPKTRCSRMPPAVFLSYPETSIGLWRAAGMQMCSFWWMPPIQTPRASCRVTEPDCAGVQSGLAKSRSRDLVRAQIRLWYNPGRDSPKFYSPGIFVLGISMFPPLLAALAMSKEGEQKTILQVYVSSITATEFLLGKIFAFMVSPYANGCSRSLFCSRLRFAYRRRSHAADRRHACSMHFAWLVSASGRLGDSQPGSRYSGRGAWRIPAGISSFRASFSR